MNKKKYYFVFVLVFFLCNADICNAQLSGLYTVNQTSPASTTNFTSVTSLANYANTFGVSGPATINIVANTGPYVEQPSFNSILGSSASNSILINGNNNTLTVASFTSTQGWVLNLNGADYMTFKNLNVIGTGLYAYGVMLSNGSDYNTFDSLNVTVPANSTFSSNIPFAFSGANTSYSVIGNCGSANKISNCNLSNGFIGVSMYGNPNLSCGNNSIINNSIRNYHYCGIFSHYTSYLSVKSCTIERPNSTVNNAIATFGIYLFYNHSAVIDGNRLRYLSGSVITNTAHTYGVYCYYNSSESSSGTAGQNIVRNNIVSDIYGNGNVYGYYAYWMGGLIYHNTLVLNNTNYNNNFATVCGFYGSSSPTSPLNFKNNLVYMTVGGNGPKYATYFYSFTSSVGLSSNYNDYYINNTGTTNFAMNGTVTMASSLPALQSMGYELNSIAVNPQFLLAANQNSYMPTNPLFDNKGINVGIINDINNQTRGIIPDIGAIETQSNICTNLLPSYAVLTPTYLICPGATVNIPFSTTYTSSGLTFSWLSSTTSSTSSWSSIPSATNQTYPTNGIFQNTWYQAIVTCTTTGNSVTLTPGQVLLAGNTTSTVPYLEDFEGININNQLPNCSWLASSANTNCLTYTTSQSNNRIPHSGNKFASFYYNPGGQHYFYSNAIQLNVGVTYSASVWFTTEQNGYTNFTDLSILLSSTQSTVGQTLLASTNGAAVSASYTSLSNTFQVTSSGLYYATVRATVNTTSMAQYLSFDDLAIIIPCQMNTPTLSVSGSTNQVCLGNSVTFTASGANTYNWGSGNTGSVMSYTPLSTSTLSVVGTNSVNCNATGTISIVVNNPPVLSITSSTNQVCLGTGATFTASGAITYSWGNGSSGSILSYTPSGTSSVSVVGTNSLNCSATISSSILVLNLPVLSMSSTKSEICANESVTITATGANSYLWSFSTQQFVGSQIVVIPQANTVYTLTGTDNNGCVNSTTLSVLVNKCTGLNENQFDLEILQIYPQPADGVLNVEIKDSRLKVQDWQIEVMNALGQRVLSIESKSNKAQIDTKILSEGVYYLRASSDSYRTTLSTAGAVVLSKRFVVGR